MSAIQLLLSTPTDDIQECPVVEPDDVKVVTSNLENILSKCLYSVRLKLAFPLEILLTVLRQAADLQLEKVCKAILQTTQEGFCVDMFCDLAVQLLSKKSASFRLQFETECFFDLVQILCGSSTLKERLGPELSQPFLHFMRDTPLHDDDYRVHRNCCSALITLIRGSRANKNRLGVECSTISECLEQSSDFFFQMQCVEVLFRLHTHNHTVLAQTPMNDFLRRGITALPNDATLLLSIQKLLDNYNAEFNADCVLSFTALRIEVDGVEVCSHTTLYFSPLLLIVLLPGGTGDSLTIPFEHIRSVKLSKDHRLGLRLNTIPLRLLDTMAVEQGRDTLHVFLTQATLKELRSCSVHQWIAERKRCAPQRAGPAVQHPPPQTGSRSTSAQSCPVSERPANFSSHQGPMKGNIGGTANESKVNVGSDLEVIHRAASIKATRYREEQREELQRGVDQVQDVLEEWRRQSAKERDQFEASFSEDMTTIRKSEAVLKESAAECVKNLNTELEDVQALGALLKAETDKVRERLAKAVGKSEGVEEAFLLHIKQSVDSRMQEMESSLVSIEASYPLDSVSQYVTQCMSNISSGKMAIGAATAKGIPSRGRKLGYS